MLVSPEQWQTDIRGESNRKPARSSTLTMKLHYRTHHPGAYPVLAERGEVLDV